MNKITERVEALIQPVLNDLNFESVDIEYVREGKDRFLRVSIDKEDGVDLNDCTIASEKISEVTDENGPVPEMYYLDVASPEAERLAKEEKDFYNVINQPIFVSLYVPVERDKEWLGVLRSVNNESISMEVKEKIKTEEIRIPRNKIVKARHAVMI